MNLTVEWNSILTVRLSCEVRVKEICQAMMVHWLCVIDDRIGLQLVQPIRLIWIILNLLFLIFFANSRRFRSGYLILQLAKSSTLTVFNMIANFADKLLFLRLNFLFLFLDRVLLVQFRTTIIYLLVSLFLGLYPLKFGVPPLFVFVPSREVVPDVVGFLQKCLVLVIQVRILR